MEKWKTIHDLPIDDWEKLAELFIKEKECFEKSKNIFGNRKLYRIIAFNTAEGDFTPYFLIKANVPGSFYHTGSYGMFGKVSISKMYWSLEFLSNHKDIYLVKEENMETKEIKISVPEGYKIDKENSTFECIKFKKKEERWKDDKDAPVHGFIITTECEMKHVSSFNRIWNYNIFATEKQARSALAMARISQIMANDERFGGVVKDEIWEKSNIRIAYICKIANDIRRGYQYSNMINYHFLAFHTEEQRDLFLKENEDLIKNYLMID